MKKAYNDEIIDDKFVPSKSIIVDLDEIVSIGLSDDKTYVLIQEEVDYLTGFRLDKNDVLRLIKELKELADKMA